MIMSMMVNDISSLFTNWNQNSGNNTSSLFQTSSNFGINLNDYATIKNGSYKKLLRAYYALDEDGAKKYTQSAIKNNTKTSGKEQAKKLAAVENSADEVKEAADALLAQGSKSVFKKVETKDASGKETLAYDTDAIYKAVDKFVTSYNTLVDKTGDSDNERVLKTAVSMVNNTKANEKLLGTIGITITSENKLSLDEEKFKASDMEAVKAVFNKTTSFGYQTSANASLVSFYAERAASQAVMYGENGTYSYNYSSGQLYNAGI